MISVETFGFYGSVSTQIEEICLVETHPESLIDLRLNQPFKELIEFSTEFDYDKLDSAGLSHVPAVVILVKALEEWKSTVKLFVSSLSLFSCTLIDLWFRPSLQHGGKVPEGMKERKEFLDSYVSKGIRKGSDDENFQEAVGLFRRAGNKRPVHTLFSSFPSLIAK